MSDLVGVIANVSLALSFVAALIFGLAQVKAAARDRKERFTLETLRAFQTREFAELMDFINSSRFPKNSEEARALTGKDNILMLEFSQKMESLGILVAEGLVDIDLVDKTLGNYVTTTWNRYKNFIVPIRERDAYLNEYFEWLSARMEERTTQNPREPFYKNTGFPAKR
jgi:hypothetical protein